MMNVAEASLWLADKTGPAVVHSVFDRSLNIQKHSELLALQSPGCPLGPMGALLERPCNFQKRGFRPGQPAFLEKQRWLIGNFVFAFSSPRFVDLTLSPSHPVLNRNRAAIDEITCFCLAHRRLAPSVSLLSLPLFADDAALVYIVDAVKDLMSSTGDIPKFCRGVSKLTGAGPGLTPSGDDILTGILFALIRDDELPGIGELLHATIEAVKKSMHKTTSIAAAFLYHATEARFSSHFLALAKALKNERAPSLLPLLRPFTAFGHSSGIDSLVGVACGLKIVANVAGETYNE